MQRPNAGQKEGKEEVKFNYQDVVTNKKDGAA